MRKLLYSIGIASFLAMLTFTVVSSLSNSVHAMSEAAVALTSETTKIQTNWYDGYFCNPSGTPGDHCLVCGPATGSFCSPANSGCPQCGSTNF